MNYMTFLIDGIESFVDLSEYCIIQKSFDCSKKPSIIFHAKHTKDFMLSFGTLIERDDAYEDIIESLTDYENIYAIREAQFMQINSDSIVYKSKG